MLHLALMVPVELEAGKYMGFERVTIHLGVDVDAVRVFGDTARGIVLFCKQYSLL